MNAAAISKTSKMGGVGGSKMDKGLDSFLTKLETDWQKRDYLDILEVASPSHRQTQLGSMGMNPSQYVAELFGLHMVNNSLGSLIDDQRQLEQVSSIRLGRLGPTDANGIVTLRGVASLRNGEQLRVEVMVQKNDQGAWELTGAVG